MASGLPGVHYGLARGLDASTTGKEVRIVTFKDGVKGVASRVRVGPRSRLAVLIVLVPVVVAMLAAVSPAGAVPPAAGSSIKYSVKPGDTLWKIAIAHDTTVNALVAANRFEDPDLIHPGEVIWVPGQAVKSAPVVQRVATKPVFPLRGYRGPVPAHWGGFEGGADLIIAEGTSIYAVMGGRVTSSGWTDRGGWNLMIDGNDGLMYYYAHMRERALPGAGAWVATGEHIGHVGNTGDSSTPHLHIAIGREISTIGNAQGLRPGYGINFDVSAFLNKLL
jgi:LysM repeat protein